MQASFQVLSRRGWPVVTILDDGSLENTKKHTIRFLAFKEIF